MAGGVFYYAMAVRSLGGQKKKGGNPTGGGGTSSTVGRPSTDVPESRSRGAVVAPGTRPVQIRFHLDGHASVRTQDGTEQDATVGTSERTRAV